jgi:hypothetical protein
VLDKGRLTKRGTPSGSPTLMTVCSWWEMEEPTALSVTDLNISRRADELWWYFCLGWCWACLHHSLPRAVREEERDGTY